MNLTGLFKSMFSPMMPTGGPMNIKTTSESNSRLSLQTRLCSKSLHTKCLPSTVARSAWLAGLCPALRQLLLYGVTNSSSSSTARTKTTSRFDPTTNNGLCSGNTEPSPSSPYGILRQCRDALSCSCGESEHPDLSALTLKGLID